MDLRQVMSRSTPTAPSGSSRRLPSLILIGILLVVAAVYAEVLGFRFLPFWDDDTNIHRNPLYSPLSWGGVLEFWKGPFQQLYIPVTYSVWAGLVAVSRMFAGTSVTFGPIGALPFHAMNLAAHLLSTAMVFLILRRMLPHLVPSRTAARSLLLASAGGALLFGLHPIQVEPVAWVSGLRDLLGGAFSLAAIALFLSVLERGEGKSFPALRYAAASLLLLLAFGSKPGSVVTPLMALICGTLILRSRKRALAPLLWLLPWFAAALLEVILTSRAQPAAELARTLVPLWARPLVACDALAFYLGRLVWPVDPWGLCADYGRSPNSLLEAGVLYWSWIVPVFLVAVLVCVKRLRPWLVPAALLAAGVLPTLGLIPFNFQVVSTVSDRYLYLAMLGPALAFAMILGQRPWRISLAIGILMISFWTVLTLVQLPEWSSGESFFPATLRRNPSSWKSRHNYACTLDAQGKLPEALAEFTEAVRLRPSNAEAYNDMALTLLKLGRVEESIRSFQQSLQIRATAGAARNLAAVLLMNGDPQQAVQVYRAAMQIDPSDLQNQRSLAWLLATHPDPAVRNGGQALELSRQIVAATDGQVPLFLLTLAASQAECGDFQAAVSTAGISADAFTRSGDPSMAATIRDRILPSFRAGQPLRGDPSRHPK
jgi:tetratricopeptide (TPR) repeat protein